MRWSEAMNFSIAIDVIRQLRTLGTRQVIELLFRHGFKHFARCADQPKFWYLAAFGREGCAGGFLLGLGLGRHCKLLRLYINRTQMVLKGSHCGAFFRPSICEFRTMSVGRVWPDHCLRFACTDPMHRI